MTTPSTPCPVGSGPISSRVASSIPTWTNRLEHPVLVQHAQRAVPGVDQVHRGLHDPPQRGVQVNPDDTDSTASSRASIRSRVEPTMSSIPVSTSTSNSRNLVWVNVCPTRATPDPRCRS